MPLKILFYGYGNPGRQDDGLGISFTEKLESLFKDAYEGQIDFDSNYQLNIEDAELIAGYDLVVFADATIEEIDDFKITKVNPSDSRVEFTMHAVSPAFVLDLCQKVFNKSPEVYLVHLRGYEWDFREGLSEKALKNLETAVDLFKSLFTNDNFVSSFQKLLE